MKKRFKFELVYLNQNTGNIDTKDNWLYAYSAEELEERGLTAEEAFEEDTLWTIWTNIKKQDTKIGKNI